MKIIFDNDAGADDAAALIYLLLHAEVAIKAITVTGTGIAHGKPGAENLIQLCSDCCRPDIPVAYGRSEPLLSCYAEHFPDSIRPLVDNLLKNKGFSELKNYAVLRNSAVKLIRETLENSAEKITILATGPLTNIAECLRYYPELMREKVERIVFMGGAVNVPGNIKDIDLSVDNDVAEWNVLADPYSADFVFKSGVPVTLVPLDATNQVPINMKFYQAFQEAKATNLEAKYIAEWMDPIVAFKGLDEFLKVFYLWDQLAAIVCLHPEMFKIEKMRISMNLKLAQLLHEPTNPYANSLDVVTEVYQPENVLDEFLNHVLKNGKPIRSHQLKQS